jgi:hypothetical protein
MILLPLFMQKLIVEAAIINVKKDLETIGKWAEINIDKKHKDIDRDKHVIEAIKKVEKAADSLLIIGVSPENINKFFNYKKPKT